MAESKRVDKFEQNFEKFRFKKKEKKRKDIRRDYEKRRKDKREFIDNEDF